MRFRKTFIIATMASATIALAATGSAFADAGSGDTSSPAPTETKAPVDTSTKPPVDTSTKPPVDTSTKPPVDTSTKPPVDTSSKPPVTEVPKTPVTETPKTPVTETPTTSVPGTPEEPEVETPTTCADTPDAAACAPETPDTRVPEAPGGGDLPFTGPGDVVLAIVLALLAGTGGILFLMGAAGREQLDVLNRRGMDSPSGFQLAYRELRKQQLD